MTDQWHRRRFVVTRIVPVLAVLLLAVWTSTSLLRDPRTASVPAAIHDPCAPNESGRFMTAEMVRYPCVTNGVRWKLLSRVSAYHALVIRIEMRNPEHAMEVAKPLIEGEQDRFTEILVYVLQSDEPEPVLARRVQWTPLEGYVGTDYQN